MFFVEKGFNFIIIMIKIQFYAIAYSPKIWLMMHSATFTPSTADDVKIGRASWRVRV